QPADHRQPADAAKLMHGRSATHIGAIFHLHVTAEQYVIDQNAMVAHTAIVPDVRTDHQHVVIADDRLGIVVPAAMDGCVLANPIVAADEQRAARVVDMHVLGPAADDGALPDLVVQAERRPAFDDG